MRFLNRFLASMRGRQDVALVTILMTSIVVMIIPMPTVVIDLLIVVNITLTLLILVVSLYIDKPTSFTTFPAVILIATTFRLAISISTTRTVLTTAEGGAIIETFGSFVTGGNLVVGLVIFAIITLVQFIVVTKGAERVAEVAARFVLDALPGRQLSIDAEARAGDITSEEAKLRRRILERESQFFGAMDGAMKFVKGDAIAGLLIVCINLLGGILIGTLQLGMSMAESTHTFSLLSIGDGLVCQIPALLLALCAGAVVTRVTNDVSGDLGESIVNELGSSSRALQMTGAVVALLGVVPGFPTIMFVTLGAALGFLGHKLARRKSADAADERARAEQQGGLVAANLLDAAAGGPARDGAGPSATADDAAPRPGDRLAIRVAPDLYARIDPAQFLAAQTAAQEDLVRRFAVPVERFGFRSDDTLKHGGFVVDLDNVPLFSDVIPDDAIGLLADEAIAIALGLETSPVPAAWRLPGLRLATERQVHERRGDDLPVVPLARLLVHLVMRLLRDRLPQIVGYDGLVRLADAMQADIPHLAEPVRKGVPGRQLIEILRALVDEKVPLTAPRAFYEALLPFAGRENETALLLERVRIGLSRHLCHAVADPNRVIAAYVIEPNMEAALRGCFVRQENGPIVFAPAPYLADALIRGTSAMMPPADPSAPDPVLVTAQDLRPHIAAILKDQGFPFAVIGMQEIAPEFSLMPLATIRLPPRPARAA